jgi:hypothetical protein
VTLGLGDVDYGYICAGCHLFVQYKQCHDCEGFDEGSAYAVPPIFETEETIVTKDTDYNFDEEITVVMSRKVFDFQTAPSFRANIVHYPGTHGWCITLQLPNLRTLEINPNSSDFVGIVSDR